MNETLSPIEKSDLTLGNLLDNIPANASDRELGSRARLAGEEYSRRLAAGSLFADRWKKANVIADTQEGKQAGETPEQEEARKRAAFELMQQCLTDVNERKLLTGRRDQIGSMWKQGGFKSNVEAFDFVSNLIRKGPEAALTEDYKEFRKLDYAGQVVAAKSKLGLKESLMRGAGNLAGKIGTFFEEQALSEEELNGADEEVRKANEILKSRDVKKQEVGAATYGDLGVDERRGEKYEKDDLTISAEKTIGEYRAKRSDEQIRSDYEQKLVKENAWLALTQILPTLEGDVKDLAEAILNSPEGKLPMELEAKARTVSSEDRQMLAQIRNLVKPVVNESIGNIIADSAIGLQNTALDIASAPVRMVSKWSREAMGLDVNELSRTRQELYALTGDLFSGADLAKGELPQLQFEQVCEEHGIIGDALIGAVSTLPYMFAAGLKGVQLEGLATKGLAGRLAAGAVSKATSGTTLVALEAMNQFDDHTIAEGGDVTNPGYMLRSFVMGGLYAYVEKLQLEKLLGGVSEMEVRKAFLKSFWDGMKSGTGPKVLFTTTLNESVEEGLQNSIMALHEALALDKDVPSEMASAFVEDFVGSLGTMAVIGAGGLVVGHAGRSGYRGGTEGLVNRSKNLTDFAKRGFAYQTLVRSNNLSETAKFNAAIKELEKGYEAYKKGEKTPYDEYYAALKADEEAKRESSEETSKAFETALKVEMEKARKRYEEYQAKLPDEARREAFGSSLEFLEPLREVWLKGRGMSPESDTEADPGAAALMEMGLAEDDARGLSELFNRERANVYSEATIEGVKKMYEESTKALVSPAEALASEFGGRLERIEGENYIRFQDGLVKIVDSGVGDYLDPNDVTEETLASVENTAKKAGIDFSREKYVNMSVEERMAWIKANSVRDEGGFKASEGLKLDADGASVTARDADKLLGTIRLSSVTPAEAVVDGEAPIQDTAAIFHEVFHAWSRFMDLAGRWKEGDIEKLIAKYGKPRTSEEKFDEEAAAEAFRAYIKRRAAGAMTAEDEGNSVFKKLFQVGKSLQTAEKAQEIRRKVAKTAEDALFEQVIADSFSSVGDLNAKPKAETKAGETKKGETSEGAREEASKGSEEKPNNEPSRVEKTRPTAATSGWSAATPTGNVRVGGKWQVFKLSELIHSNNPLYAKYMRNQLRNRKDNKAEESKREEIIENFDAARLFEAPDTANGAPIVFMDKDDEGNTRPFVLSGNGRVLVLNAMAERHLFDRYRNYMKSWAKENGLKVPEDGSDYVVVRVLEDLGGSTREQIADLSNTNSIQQYTEEEQARADAEVIKSLDLARLYHANKNGSADMTPGVNDEFFRQFIQGVGDTSLLNSDGSITESARARAVRALLAIAVGQGDRGRDVVKKLVEQTDTLRIVRQENAAAIMAASVAALETNPDYAIGADLSRAMADYIDFAEKKKAEKVKDFGEYFAQMDLLDAPSEVARGILELFGSKLGANEIAEYVIKYANTAKVTDADGGLFGAEAARTKSQLWADVKRSVDESRAAVGELKAALESPERKSVKVIADDQLKAVLKEVGVVRANIHSKWILPDGSAPKANIGHQQFLSKFEGATRMSAFNSGWIASGTQFVMVPGKPTHEQIKAMRLVAENMEKDISVEGFKSELPYSMHKILTEEWLEEERSILLGSTPDGVATLEVAGTDGNTVFSKEYKNAYELYSVGANDLEERFYGENKERKSVKLSEANPYHEGEVREIVEGIKRKDPSSLKKAAEAMAKAVKTGDALVPVPSHLGYAEETLALAEEISRLTGAPVVDALKSTPRSSNYEKEGLGVLPSANTLGMFKTANVPEGRRVVLVDNLVGTGTAAAAAAEAMGEGEVLAFAWDMNAPTIEKASSRSERHSFVGAMAIDKAKIAKAEALEKEGKSQEEIYDATKLWRGRNGGGWREERYDDTLQLAKMLQGESKSNQQKLYLYPFIDNLPEENAVRRLAENYPRLLDLFIIIADKPMRDKWTGVTIQYPDEKRGFKRGQAAGFYVDASRGTKQIAETLAHELQHFIQGEEGWSFGTNEELEGEEAYFENLGENEAATVGYRLHYDKSFRPWEDEKYVSLVQRMGGILERPDYRREILEKRSRENAALGDLFERRSVRMNEYKPNNEALNVFVDGTARKLTYVDSKNVKRELVFEKGDRKYGADKIYRKHVVDGGRAATGGFTLEELDKYLDRILSEGKKEFDKARQRRTFSWVSPEGVTFYIGTFMRNGVEVVNTIHTNRGETQTKKLATHLGGKTSSVKRVKNSLSYSPENVNGERRSIRMSSAEAKTLMPNTKVVDERGNPIVVYHRTGSDFDKFDLGKARKSMDIQGFFFYADENAGAEYGKRVIPAYLDITKPYVIDSAEKMNAIPWDQSTEGAGVRAREWLKAKGYDGVVRKAEFMGDSSDEWIALDESQIISADGQLRHSFAIGRVGAANLKDALFIAGGLTRAREMLNGREWKKLKREEKVKIKVATGWEKGADGKWRYEIDDFPEVPMERLKVPNPDYVKMEGDEAMKNPEKSAKYKAVKLGDLWKRADSKKIDLFKAYPWFKDWKVVYGAYFNNENIFGSTSLDKRTIKLNEAKLPDVHALRSTLVHELQHVIQDYEKFSIGGNQFITTKLLEKKFLNAHNESEKLYQDILTFLSERDGGKMSEESHMNHQIWRYHNWNWRQYRATSPEVRAAKAWLEALPGWDKFDKRFKDFRKKYGHDPKFFENSFGIYSYARGSESFDMYKSLMGETEARNASRRFFAQDNDRFSDRYLWEDTEDVARKDQVMLDETYNGLLQANASALERHAFASLRGGNRLGITPIEDPEAMEARGEDRHAIYEKTGWWRAADGKWRVELPWSGKFNKEGEGMLRDYFDWPELFEAYPELKETRVVVQSEDEMLGAWGEWDGEENTIYISEALKKRRNRNSLPSTLIHEVQHAIQEFELLAPGGSPSMFFADPNADEKYFKLAGEVEARNVAERLAMGREEKLARPPWVTEDTSIDDQIVLPAKSGKERYSINFDKRRNLIAVHGLSRVSLEKAIKAGGLVMPSAAIVDAADGWNTAGYHDMYSERGADVYVVFPKAVIDRSTTEIFGGDAYTPTFRKLADMGLLSYDGEVPDRAALNAAIKEFRSSFTEARANTVRASRYSSELWQVLDTRRLPTYDIDKIRAALSHDKPPRTPEEVKAWSDTVFEKLDEIETLIMKAAKLDQDGQTDIRELMAAIVPAMQGEVKRDELKNALEKSGLFNTGKALDQLVDELYDYFVKNELLYTLSYLEAKMWDVVPFADATGAIVRGEDAKEIDKAVKLLKDAGVKDVRVVDHSDRPEYGYDSDEAVRAWNKAHRHDVEDLERQMAERFSVAIWPREFPKVTVMTTRTYIDQHYKDLFEKAKAGDVVAAADLVEKVASRQESLDKLKALAANYPDAILLPIKSLEKTGENMIPAAYARYIANKTGLGYEGSVFLSNKPNHTGATALERLMRRAVFTGEVEDGAEYIIVDDRVTMGSTINDLRRYITENGGKVVAATTLTYSRNSVILSLSEGVKQRLAAIKNIDQLLQESGIANGYEEITEREGQYLSRLTNPGGVLALAASQRKSGSGSGSSLGQAAGAQKNGKPLESTSGGSGTLLQITQPDFAGFKVYKDPAGKLGDTRYAKADIIKGFISKDLNAAIDAALQSKEEISAEEAEKLLKELVKRVAETKEGKKVLARYRTGSSFNNTAEELADPKNQKRWQEIEDKIFAPIVDAVNNPDAKSMFESGEVEPYKPEIGHEAHIVVGPPAAGKSSVFVVPLSVYHKARVMDADIIKGMIPGFDKGNGASYVHEESSMLNKRFIKRVLTSGENVVIPIVGANEKKVRQYIDDFKKAGYKVFLHNNYVPILHAYGSALVRTLSTGRWIAPEVFTDTLDKPTEVFDRVKRFADGFDEFNNDGPLGAEPIYLGASPGYSEKAYADRLTEYNAAVALPKVSQARQLKFDFGDNTRRSIAMNNPNMAARRAVRFDIQDNRNKVAENALINYVTYFRLAHNSTPRAFTISRLGLSMGMNTVSPKIILDKSEKFAERMRGSLIEKAAGNGDVDTAMALLKRENELDQAVGRLISGGVEAGGRLTNLGVGTINQTIAKRVSEAMRGLTAATLADMERDTGLDIAAEILANNPNAFDEEIKKAKGATVDNQQNADEDDTGNAGAGGGEDESRLSDYERFKRETARKAALKRLEEFIANAKARADMMRQRAEERRKRAEANGDNLGSNGNGGGEGDFGSRFPEPNAPKNMVAGFKTKEEFAAFMRVWAEDRFDKVHGRTTLAKAERDKLFAEFYRITVRQELQDLADKLLAPRGARAYVNRRLGELEKDLRPDTIERMSANLFAFINKAAIREARTELVRKFKLEIKQYIQGREFEQLKLDSDRRVTGWVEEVARYISRVCDLSRREINGAPSELARERKLLTDIVDKRARVYDESGKEIASAAMEDLETKKAMAKLALLDKYGAMTSLMPGQILDLQAEALGYLQSEAIKLAELWRDSREFEDSVRADLASSITGPKGQRYQEKGIFNGKLFNALNGMLRLRLKHLTRFAPDEKRKSADAAINQIVVLLGDGETAYNRQLQADREAFYSGLAEIFTDSRGKADMAAMKAYLNRMTETVPVELSREISNQGFAEGMTWGQVLQLLVSLEQRSFKNAIEENGRVGQAEKIRAAISDQDVKFVDWIRAFYSENRKVISPVLKRMVGLEVDSPDPLYAPVKRSMDDRARGLHSDPSPRWDPIASVFTRRIENSRDFDESASIIGMFFDRSNETAKLVAWAERGSLLRGIFTDAKIQNAIRRSFGNGELSTILKQLEYTLNGGKSGGSTPGELAAVDKALNFTTYAYLGFNPLSAAKQTTSITVWANALPGGFKDLWKYMTNVDTKVIKHLKESEEYKVRYGNEVGSGQDQATKILNRNPSLNPIVRMFSGAGMWLLKKGDFVPGGWIAQGVYKDRLDMHLQEGMEEEAADKLAITETFNLLEETQQSGRSYNTSELQRNEYGRLLTQFATSSLQQLQYETQALREYVDMKRYDMGEKKIAAAREKLLRAVVINHLLIPAALNFVTALFKAAVGDEPPWEKEGWHWTLLTEILMGQFSRVFFLGVFAQTSLKALFNRETPRMSQILPVEGAVALGASVAITAHDFLTLNPENLQKDFERLMKSTAPTRIPYKIYKRMTGDSDVDRKRKSNR